MSLLAIDTSYDYCTVIVSSMLKKSHRSYKIPQEKAQSILFLIDEVLRETNISLSDLQAIGFTSGPGSFTGLRIAAAVVQGLAYALNIPVVPFSTLQAIAQSVFLVKKIEEVRIVLNAHRNQAYVGVYKLDATSGIMQALVPDSLVKQENIKIDSVYINEKALMQLTEYHYRSGCVKRAADAIPVYLQQPV